MREGGTEGDDSEDSRGDFEFGYLTSEIQVGISDWGVCGAIEAGRDRHLGRLNVVCGESEGIGIEILVWNLETMGAEPS